VATLRYRELLFVTPVAKKLRLKQPVKFPNVPHAMPKPLYAFDIMGTGLIMRFLSI
jgi:hypothetical protein